MVASRFCYNWNLHILDPLKTKETMIWRVATRSGKNLQEVIDPEDWNILTPEHQLTYQSVSEFDTEQEADRFASDQTELTKPPRTKLPHKKK